MNSQHILPLGPLHGLRLARIHCFTLCASLTAPGCASWVGPGPVFEPTQEQLRVVEPLPIEARSRSTPLPLDQAPAVSTEAITPRAQGTAMDLSLASVRASALANNLDLQVELFNPLIEDAVVSEEEAKFEALFFGSAGTGRIDTPRLEGGRVTGEQTSFLSYEAGVRLPLRTGGIATVSLPHAKLEDGGTTHAAQFSFSISQPLLRNAGFYVNTHSIRIARHTKQVVDARTKLQAIRILANADRVYWILYAARGELEVRQKQYELAQRQLDQAQKRVAAGDSARIEITRADSGLAERLEAIILADTRVRRVERELKRLMNRVDIPVHSDIVLNLTTTPNPVGLDLDAQTLAQNAESMRMELLELEIQLAMDESTITFAENSRLPLFSLDYTYRVNGLGTSFSKSHAELGDRDFEDWALQLTAEIPLGNKAARSRLRQAVLEREKRLATRESRRQAIRQEVFDALDDLKQNWQRIIAARQAAILAGRTYQAEVSQFELGVRTSTDVLFAAERLATAQIREVSALSDYQISQVDIAFATGSLLGQDRVQVGQVNIE